MAAVPLEIQWHIVGLLDSTQNTKELQACRLVCRAWNDVAEPSLFAVFCAVGGKRDVDFGASLAFIRTHREIARLIHILRLRNSMTFHPTHSPQINDQIATLSAYDVIQFASLIPNLEVVDFSHILFEGDISPSRGLYPSMVAFHAREVVCTTRRSALLNLLALQPSWELLDVGDCVWSRNSPMPSKSYFRVKEFRLDWPHSAQLTAQFSQPFLNARGVEKL